MTSKLDQLKALGDAKRASRRPPKSTPIPFQGGAGKGSAAARTDVLQTVGATVSVRSGSKLKRGRPKITDKRPWEQEGISRRTWYRRKAEEKK